MSQKLVKGGAPEEHWGYVDLQRGQWSQHMQSFLEVPFNAMLSVSGEGIAGGEVCVVGLTNSVHGTGRVYDGVGK